jgi:hypothetical protein
MRRLTLFSLLFAIELLSRLSTELLEGFARRNANVAAGGVILDIYQLHTLCAHSGGNTIAPHGKAICSVD